MVKYTGKLYHCTDLKGALWCLNCGMDSEISCSTPASSRLIGRECCMVLEVSGVDGAYSLVDMGAQKNYGWDEFIYTIPDRMYESLVTIVLSPRLYQVWEKEDWRTDEDDLRLLYELAEDFAVKFVRGDELFYNFWPIN